MKLTVYRDDSVFATLRPEWNALLHRSATDMIFLTWEWQTTWWQVFSGCGELLVVEVRSDAGELVGLAPWFVHHAEGERVLRTIGCVDVTDYVDVVANRDALEPVLDALAEFLAQNESCYDRINLCNIPEHSPTLLHLPDDLREHDFEADIVLQEVCPVIHLPTDWEAYLSMLDKKQRHEIRRKIRRAETEGGAQAEVFDFTQPGAVLDSETLESFFDLMARSQPAKAEFLADERNRRFMAAILHTTAEAGWLRLSFLRCGGQRCAAYADFIYGGQVQVYNSGLDPEIAPHLSAGVVLLAYNIQNAIERGLPCFNFLRGNESYKYRMGAADTRIYMLKARLNTDAAAEPGAA